MSNLLTFKQLGHHGTFYLAAFILLLSCVLLAMNSSFYSSFMFKMSWRLTTFIQSVKVADLSVVVIKKRARGAMFIA